MTGACGSGRCGASPQAVILGKAQPRPGTHWHPQQGRDGSASLSSTAVTPAQAGVQYPPERVVARSQLRSGINAEAQAEPFGVTGSRSSAMPKPGRQPSESGTAFPHPPTLLRLSFVIPGKRSATRDRRAEGVAGALRAKPTPTVPLRSRIFGLAASSGKTPERGSSKTTRQRCRWVPALRSRLCGRDDKERPDLPQHAPLPPPSDQRPATGRLCRAPG